MTRRHVLVILACFALFPSGARAGLYYSGEEYAALPAQWRGFLLDQRALRNIAVNPPPGQSASLLRLRYQEAAAALEKRRESLGADELADLGALYVRLAEIDRAVAVLREAQRRHPNHFA